MPRKRSISDLKVRRWRAADARQVLAAQAASGLSMRAFAAREGLKIERLERWRRDLAAVVESAAAQPAFVEMRRRKRRAVEPVMIVLRSGRMVRVAESIDSDALKRIIDALEDPAGC